MAAVPPSKASSAAPALPPGFVYIVSQTGPRAAPLKAATRANRYSLLFRLAAARQRDRTAAPLLKAFPSQNRREDANRYNASDASSRPADRRNGWMKESSRNALLPSL
jgi:hypothetical protein